MKLLYGVTLISSLSEILFLNNFISFFLYDELKSVVKICIFNMLGAVILIRILFLRNKVTLFKLIMYTDAIGNLKTVLEFVKLNKNQQVLILRSKLNVQLIEEMSINCIVALMYTDYNDEVRGDLK